MKVIFAVMNTTTSSMIRFSPWGAYLHLVPQRGKVPIQNRLLIGDRVLIDEIKTAQSEAKL